MSVADEIGAVERRCKVSSHIRSVNGGCPASVCLESGGVPTGSGQAEAAAPALQALHTHDACQCTVQ